MASLYAQIISVREEGWVHNTNLTPPLCIGVPVPSQKTEWSSNLCFIVSTLSLFLRFFRLDILTAKDRMLFLYNRQKFTIIAFVVSQSVSYS